MPKQMFNMHTHTRRCGHADGNDEQYVRAAIMAGFTTIGFSEHMPYPGIDKPGERMLSRDVADYLQSLQELKKRYEKQIDIKIGFEIEYFDDQIAYLEMMRKDCDYMIQGQHCRYYDGCGYDYLSDDEAVLAYGEQVVKGMQSGLISMLAHPDYFMLGRRDFSAVCEQVTHTICKASVQYNIPLEINLNGIRYGKLPYAKGEAYPYPYLPFWQIAQNYPIHVVYGFDAHSPVTLLEQKRIEVVDEILKDCNLTYVKEFVIK